MLLMIENYVFCNDVKILGSQSTLLNELEITAKCYNFMIFFVLMIVKIVLNCTYTLDRLIL